MNTVSTRQAPIMETVTCSWTASVFTTMRLLVGTSPWQPTGAVTCRMPVLSYDITPSYPVMIVCSL